VKKSTRCLFFALAAVTSIRTAEAARWGRHGHAEITYDAASGKLGLKPEIAKIMALGSLAPDLFEFEVPAAHAQMPDPEIENNRLKIGSEKQYRELQRKAFVDSFRWHEFYFNAAVTAMRRGHRERAAFLLGYALHNTEDFGNHQGMPNLVHAYLDGGGASPDFETKRLALAHSAASADIAAFRSQIGDENWRLFQGQSVRRANGQTVVPEPIQRFGTSLDRWDPRSGILPPPEGLHPYDLKGLTLHEIFRSAASARGYPIDPRTGQETEHHKDVMIYNFVEGLLPLQDEMLGCLRVGDLSIERKSGDPREPERLDAAAIVRYAIAARDFAKGAPKRFLALPEADRALLKSTNWLECGGDYEHQLIAQQEELRSKFTAECKDRIKVISERLKDKQETLRWIAWNRSLFQKYEANWAAEIRLRRSLIVPVVDARPREELPDIQGTREASSSADRSSHESHVERERSPSNHNFNSPTFNQLKSGNYKW
jgi:hypothetical protein